MEITKRGKQIFHILKFYYKTMEIKIVVIIIPAEKGIQNIGRPSR
jgi:hypothetical protein